MNVCYISVQDFSSCHFVIKEDKDKIYRNLILPAPYTGVIGCSYEGKIIGWGIGEQGVEGDIWAQVEGANRILEKKIEKSREL
jgi:hypothetical protein